MRFDGRMMMVAGIVLALAGCDKAADDTSGSGQPAAAIAPPAGTSWADAVVETANGGYLMGNPNAPVKLVEYASLTCPHCRDFARDAQGPLRDNYVASGRVSSNPSGFRPACTERPSGMAAVSSASPMSMSWSSAPGVARPSALRFCLYHQT